MVYFYIYVSCILLFIICIFMYLTKFPNPGTIISVNFVRAEIRELFYSIVNYILDRKEVLFLSLSFVFCQCFHFSLAEVNIIFLDHTNSVL